ncbi:hypothetical protein GJW-30_1_03479 [Variibacter gotjawalensis]|uniref:Uncharacterized protein n=1 Tax=Variibacter gotjawalensis TaxID=1333996 RepID=A0A0S3PYA3_9BRAD|nr:hypothetical protein [Variibacter gotjawalensis]NIK46765.1 hypothetical protein [Variibacter gotjawalensis]RZS48669.1 hypothetical protein EV661_1084 [Variibacter gotjawalensis]BAT60929.1 hypothetical protein GJW-30_1_03479 [Variibacter gotjawalensis]
MKSFAAALALTVLVGAMAPAGAQPQINIQTGATDFRDVTLGSPATGTVTIGRIALTGFTTQGDNARASRAELQNIVITIGTSRTEVPSIVMTDVSAPASLFQALTKGNAVPNLPDLLRATTIADIQIASAKLRDPGSKSEAEYSDFSLKSLANGIAQSARLARSVSQAVAPTGEAVTTTMGETVYGKTDIAELVRFVTGGGSGEAKSLVDRMTIASFTVKMPQVEIDFGKVEIAGVYGRAPATAMPIAEIQALTGAMPGGTGPQGQKLAAYYREVLQTFRVERYAFIGAKVKSDLGVAELGTIAMENFSGQSLGRFSIAGAGVALPTGPIRLGEFEIKGFNWKKLLDFGLEIASTGKEPDVTPDQIMALIPSLDALRFANLTAGTPFGPMSLGEMRIEVPAGPRGTPEQLAWSIKALKADVSKLPPDVPLADEIKALGYSELTANADVKVRYIAAEKAAVIEVPKFEISDVGAIDLSARVTNIGPGGVDDLDEAPVEQLTLGITDGGLGNRVFRAFASGAGISPEAMRAAAAIELKNQATALFGPALTPGSAQAVEEFIKSGERLVLTIKPKPGAAPVKLGEISEPTPEVVSRITVTIARPGRLNIMDQMRRP